MLDSDYNQLIEMVLMKSHTVLFCYGYIAKTNLMFGKKKKKKMNKSILLGCLLICPKTAGWMANSVDPDQMLPPYLLITHCRLNVPHTIYWKIQF